MTDTRFFNGGDNLTWEEKEDLIKYMSEGGFKVYGENLDRDLNEKKDYYFATLINEEEDKVRVVRIGLNKEMRDYYHGLRKAFRGPKKYWEMMGK